LTVARGEQRLRRNGVVLVDGDAQFDPAHGVGAGRALEECHQDLAQVTEVEPGDPGGGLEGVRRVR
jgi:hypothetical protein